MSSITEKTEKARIWLAAGLLFLLTSPMWVWGINQLFMAFFSIMIFLVSFPKIKLAKSSKWMSFAFFLQIIFLWVAIVTEKTNLNGFIVLFMTILAYSTIFLCEKEYWKLVIDKFVIILAILLIPSLIEYVLISFLGVNIPYHYITECPVNPERDYYIYNFNAYLVDNILLDRVRFFGFFDEPGVVGNVMMVLLFVQKFNFRKWHNIVLLLAGVFSFSLTFFFALMAYYLIVGGIKTKLSFIILAVVLVALFYDNPIVEDLIFSRMAIEDGQLAGYNREGADFDSWFSHRTVSEYFFWGYSGNVEYAASWKWALVRWGIVPCFLYVFSIFLSAVQSRLHLRDLALVLIILVIIFIQRPFFMNFLYAFIFVVPHLYLSANQNQSTLLVNSKPNQLGRGIAIPERQI